MITKECRNTLEVSKNQIDGNISVQLYFPYLQWQEKDLREFIVLNKFYGLVSPFYNIM